jgi:hypothetical protein
MKMEIKKDVGTFFVEPQIGGMKGPQIIVLFENDEKIKREYEEKIKKAYEEQIQEKIYFEFSDRAEVLWCDGEICLAGWVLKNKALSEKQKEYIKKFFKNCNSILSTPYNISGKYIDKKYIPGENGDIKTIDEIEKELQENPKFQEYQEIMVEKKKYNFVNNKIIYEDREIGYTTYTKFFDNSFGDSEEGDWIQGHPDYIFYSEAEKEKFSKLFKIEFFCYVEKNKTGMKK